MDSVEQASTLELFNERVHLIEVIYEIGEIYAGRQVATALAAIGYSTAVAQRRTRLHVPEKRSERDALIVATALVHGVTVVTLNVLDFCLRVWLR